MDCIHKKTHMVMNPDEPHVGPSIEVCDECRMSRSHWEQGESAWVSVNLCDNCDAPTDNTGDQAAGIKLCDSCKVDPRGRSQKTEATVSVNENAEVWRKALLYVYEHPNEKDFPEWVENAVRDAAVAPLFATRSRRVEGRCPICGGTEHADPLPGTSGRRCVKCCNVVSAPAS